jgi:hypothetical protein
MFLRIFVSSFCYTCIVHLVLHCRGPSSGRVDLYLILPVVAKRLTSPFRIVTRIVILVSHTVSLFSFVRGLGEYEVALRVPCHHQQEPRASRSGDLVISLWCYLRTIGSITVSSFCIGIALLFLMEQQSRRMFSRSVRSSKEWVLCRYSSSALSRKNEVES